MLQSILMPVQLTEYSTEVKMSICQSSRLIYFKFQLQSLYKIGQSCPNFTSPTVVAREIVISGRFELQRIPRNQLRLPQVIDTKIKLLLLQIDHGGEVEVLAEFLG
jgi:hypothetical protein